ncbi:MAG TPA: cupin domain-containing protein [Gemmatimonadaceae bacterium]|nr:cupin domain-containing protein [Gemmatimonadaceae bacterium]
MSPVRHQVTGHALSFAIDEEIRTVRGELAAAHGRSARTLVKDGPLRVTLVAVSPGGELREHRADGPITIQVLDGEIELRTGERSWTLAAGTLFALDAGIPHAVRSARGGIFLLTVVFPAAGESAEPRGGGA